MFQASIPSPTIPLEGTREADTNSTMPFSPSVRLVLIMDVLKLLSCGSALEFSCSYSNSEFDGKLSAHFR